MAGAELADGRSQSRVVDTVDLGVVLVLVAEQALHRAHQGAAVAPVDRVVALEAVPRLATAVRRRWRQPGTATEVDPVLVDVDRHSAVPLGVTTAVLVHAFVRLPPGLAH